MAWSDIDLLNQAHHVLYERRWRPWSQALRRWLMAGSGRVQAGRA